MKKVDVVLGLQWGDEGKGKVVDVLTPNYTVVARFQGGPNAGHSLHFGDKSFVLRHLTHPAMMKLSMLAQKLFHGQRVQAKTVMHMQI